MAKIRRLVVVVVLVLVVVVVANVIVMVLVDKLIEPGLQFERIDVGRTLDTSCQI